MGLVKLGLVLIVAYVPMRLALGAVMKRRLCRLYGSAQYARMIDTPDDPNHRAMAHRAHPLWFRALAKSTFFLAPTGIVFAIIGLVR